MNEGEKTYLPVVTFILIGINMLVFFYVLKNGDYNDVEYMYNIGAMSTESIIEGHEYHRLITNMFLHFGWEHLMNNMFSLFVMGYSLENMIGKVRFTVVYFVAGLMGSVFSILHDLYFNGEYAVSAGASGAIYGLLGGVFATYLFSRDKRLKEGLPRFFIFLIISLYAGFRDPTVGGDAHFGGLVAGFVLCAIFSSTQKKEIIAN